MADGGPRFNISEDPDVPRDKARAKFVFEQKPKTVSPAAKKAPPAETPPPKEQPQLPNQLSSPQQQAQAALQLRQVRAPAMKQSKEDEAEENARSVEQAEQSVMPPKQLEAASAANLNRIKTQRAEELKNAKKKFKEFEYKKKVALIKQKYKEKFKKEAEKNAKVAAQKIAQAGADSVVTLIQEVGPVILEVVTWACLLLLGACGAIDWIADWAVAAVNLIIRGVAQYQRLKKIFDAVAGKGSPTSFPAAAKDLAQRFITQSILPVAAGAIMESIPYVDYLPWAEIGAGISGLLIVADLLRSYVKAKTAQAQAEKMANSA